MAGFSLLDFGSFGFPDSRLGFGGVVSARRRASSRRLSISPASSFLAVPTIKYAPAGKCIYCGDLASKDTRLGEEHIIPRSIGGTLVLPEASCRKCERETSRIETYCAKHYFYAARVHEGIRGRRARGPKTLVQTELVNPPERIKMDVKNHPGLLDMWLLPPPDVFGPSTGETALVDLVGIVLVPDFHERIQKTSFRYRHAINVSLNQFTRLLAKIGHSYACAVIGEANFKPYLLDLIFWRLPLEPLKYIGGYSIELSPFNYTQPPSKERHEIQLEISRRSGKNLVLVKLRLFSQYSSPNYCIVVGESVEND